MVDTIVAREVSFMITQVADFRQLPRRMMKWIALGDLGSVVLREIWTLVRAVAVAALELQEWSGLGGDSPRLLKRGPLPPLQQLPLLTTTKWMPRAALKTLRPHAAERARVALLLPRRRRVQLFLLLSLPLPSCLAVVVVTWMPLLKCRMRLASCREGGKVNEEAAARLSKKLLLRRRLCLH
jgi:hypothetical protein